MTKEMQLRGKLVSVELILPEQLKTFLKRNEITENAVLQDYHWESCLEEDLMDKDLSAVKKLTIVINYLHITQQNQIRVEPKDFASGTLLTRPSWSKGSFLPAASIGYAVFAEP